ncbi:MAG TPA: hypothetical protein VEA69_10520 [Tepidisphaeraceae bacterium]|nr:hypothetical protein [Tepidisphaeraceae bacterium]
MAKQQQPQAAAPAHADAVPVVKEGGGTPGPVVAALASPNAPAAPPASAAPAVEVDRVGVPDAVVERTSDGRLTLHGMRQVIASGGSVLHGGRVISRLADLPSPADMGDAADLSAEASRLDREIAALTATRNRVDAARRDREAASARPAARRP